MKAFISHFLLFLGLGSLCSCSMLMNDRRFIDEMENQQEGFFTPGQDFKVTPGDIGGGHRSYDDIMRRTPASTPEKKNWIQQSALKKELYYLETHQPSYLARDYYSIKDHLPTVSEKIYYLKMKSLEDREQYLYSRGLKTAGFSVNRSEIAQALKNQDILLGMSKDEVVSSWGRPARVDVAGDPRYQNERWSYYERGKLKKVFFESGKVQGWSAD